MTVDTLNKNLGTIKVGIPTTFTYLLTAEAFPVIFTKISAGCSSCTVANIQKSSIDALEEIYMKVTFTPNGTGEQTKKITVSYTEDGNKLNKDFTFTATVIS